MRQRRRGGGRKGRLADTADTLVFILMYFRLYPIQTVQGLLFGMGQPQANEWVHRLAPVLNAALGREQQLPARKPRDLDEVLGECEGLEFLIDGVERPHPAPQEPRTPAVVLQRQEEAALGQEQPHHRETHLEDQGTERDLRG